MATTESATPTRQGFESSFDAATAPTSKRPGSPLYSSQALEALRKNLKIVYRRKGYDTPVADTIFKRLTANLRLLDKLHALARRVITGDRQAARRFYHHLNDLSMRVGQPGAARLLRDRAGPGPINRPPTGALPGAASAPAHRTLGAPAVPCGGLVGVPGMAEIHGAIWGVYVFNLGELTQPPSNELSQAIDTVAGLSLGLGHLEVLYHRFRQDGIDGLTDTIEWGEASSNPYFDPVSPGRERPMAGPPARPVGDPSGPPSPPLPSRSGPAGFTPNPADPTGGGGGPVNPPLLDDCEQARQACEGILIDIFNRGAPSSPPQARASWAHNIDHIEHQGLCAGDTIIIHGHDFGDPQPDNVQLVMKVGGVCQAVPVSPDNWSDTRIEVVLPPGVSPGPVGFHDPTNDLSTELYNGWVGRVNQDLRRINQASRCLGTPFEFPTLPPGISGGICPPETEVNVIQAGEPIIHAFSVSTGDTTGAVVVAEPEDELTLAWQVENTDTLELRRLSSTGPDFNGDNTLENPPGTTYDLGPAGHSQISIFRYRLQATNGCGTVSAEVQVRATKRPGLAIEAIEVTQGVQTLDHQVQLVAHKPTVVRVYASHQLEGFIPDDIVPEVGGRLRIRTAGGWLSPWLDPINGASSQAPDPPFPNAGAAIDLPADIDRTRTDDTLNFLIPAGWCDGTLDIQAQIRVADFGAQPGEPGLDEQVSRSFEAFITFAQRRPLKIRFIPARVNLPNNSQITVLPGFSNPPTDQECLDFLLETFKFYPTTPESIEPLEGHRVLIEGGRVVITTDAGTFPIDLGFLPIATESILYDVHANALLEWYGVLQGCDFVDVTGFVCPDNDDEIWVILAPVTGVWGRAHWAADVCITPMRQVSTAHEIAHTLNQHHITPAGCSGGGSAVGNHPTSDPDTWEDGGEIVPDKVVPFDVIRNRTITAGSDGVWDLMTYCGTRWTHAQRWAMLFHEIGD